MHEKKSTTETHLHVRVCFSRRFFFVHFLKDEPCCKSITACYQGGLFSSTCTPVVAVAGSNLPRFIEGALSSSPILPAWKSSIPLVHDRFFENRDFGLSPGFSCKMYRHSLDRCKQCVVPATSAEVDNTERQLFKRIHLLKEVSRKRQNRTCTAVQEMNTGELQ
jgi:hypothetical protein